MLPASESIHFRMMISGNAFLMRRLPECLQYVAFEPARHARAARDLLNLSFADGGGEVLEFAEWWDALTEDDEFDTDLCFAVETIGEGRLIAFAQCWISGFVKDLAVHPEFRGCGVGRTLMMKIFCEFARRGVDKVDLRARRDNPSGAIQFYKTLGMQEIPQIAAADPF